MPVREAKSLVISYKNKPYRPVHMVDFTFKMDYFIGGFYSTIHKGGDAMEGGHSTGTTAGRSSRPEPHIGVSG